MKSIFTASVLVIFSMCALGQNSISSVDYTRKNAEKSVVATQEGFALATYNNQKKKLKHDVTYTFFDSNLKKVNEITVNEYRISEQKQSVYSANYLHMVYGYAGNILIYSIPTQGGEAIHCKVKTKANFFLNSIAVLGDKLFVLGKDFYGHQGSFKVVNWKTGEELEEHLLVPNTKTKVMPLSMLTMSDGGCVLFGSNRSKQNGYDTQMFRYNNKGEQVAVTTFEGVYSKSHIVSETGDGSLIISGTVSEKAFKPSMGVFFAMCQDDKVQLQKEVLFTEIDGFLDFSPKEYKKGNKIGQVRVVPSENGYFVWGESFYVNNYKMNEKTYFDSYQFTHGFACFFDNEGEINTTASFETDYKVENRSQFYGKLEQKDLGAGKLLIYRLRMPYAFEIDVDDESINEVDSDLTLEEDVYVKEFDADYQVVKRNEDWDLGYVKNRANQSIYTFFKIPHQ